MLFFLLGVWLPRNEAKAGLLARRSAAAAKAGADSGAASQPDPEVVAKAKRRTICCGPRASMREPTHVSVTSESDLKNWPDEGSGWSRFSGSPAFVAMVQSAELGQRHDSPHFRWLNRSRLGRVLPQRKMRSRSVIVLEIRGQGST